MGYYTYFELNIEAKSESAVGTEETLLDQLREESDGAKYFLGEDAESGKWYEHADDMMAFSAKNPGWLFTLKGEGEESGDLWVKYFFDGKMQHAPANISFADFDESQLTSMSRKPQF